MEEEFWWIHPKISANVNGLDLCIPLDCLVFANHHGHHCPRDPGCGRKHLCGYGKHPEAFWSFLWGTESMAENSLRNVCFPFEKSNRWRLYGQPVTLMKENLELSSLLSPFLPNTTYLGVCKGDILNHRSNFLRRNLGKWPGPSHPLSGAMKDVSSIFWFLPVTFVFHDLWGDNSLPCSGLTPKLVPVILVRYICLYGVSVQYMLLTDQLNVRDNGLSNWQGISIEVFLS